jgi:hypothetical protein
MMEVQPRISFSSSTYAPNTRKASRSAGSMLPLLVKQRDQRQLQLSTRSILRLFNGAIVLRIVATVANAMGSSRRFSVNKRFSGSVDLGNCDLHSRLIADSSQFVIRQASIVCTSRLTAERYGIFSSRRKVAAPRCRSLGPPTKLKVRRQSAKRGLWTLDFGLWTLARFDKDRDTASCYPSVWQSQAQRLNLRSRLRISAS